MSLPPRGAVTLSPPIGPAMEAADRLIVGLVDRDEQAISRELGLEVCAWWRDGSTLASLHGPAAVASALIQLLATRPPDRLTARPSSEGSVVVSALSGDHLAWSLELRAERGHFVGCIVRGASRPAVEAS